MPNAKNMIPRIREIADEFESEDPTYSKLDENRFSLQVFILLINIAAAKYLVHNRIADVKIKIAPTPLLFISSPINFCLFLKL